MKAAVLEHYGAPEEFKIKNIDPPEVKEGQVLIYNRASSVNPVDTLVRQGKTKLITGLFGDQIIGADFSGIVQVSKSKHFRDGDEVFGMNSAVLGGAYAEVVVADENNVCLKPANMTFTEAASLPLVALTAWQGLTTLGKIMKRDRVLITGCTGGVGAAAVEIAKSFEAVVTGTCSSKHSSFARSLGVDKVFNYDKEEVPEDARFDLIFDASGNYSIRDFKENLTEKAMFVSTRGGATNAMGAAEAAIDLAFQKRMKIVRVSANSEDLNYLKQLAEADKLHAWLARVFPLEELAAAHKMMEEESFTGKIAIEI